MQNSTTFTITDDSGFLAIVNADKYNSFISEDWKLPQLFKHFVDEMNNDNLILWSTGSENTWTVTFVNKPSEIKSFKEFHKTLEVTSGKVFLTNYEELTMAAQYYDERIPATHNAALSIDLSNGKHNFLIRQLFNPNDNRHETEENVHFEIVVQPYSGKNFHHIDNVFWLTY